MTGRVYFPRAQRFPVNREFASVEEYLSEYVANVSRTGAFIRSRDPLPIGTRVNLKFSLILDELEIIEGIGEVVRVSQSPPGMGVVFRRLSPASQELIETLCARAPTHERRP
jgi:PilZ domain